MTHQRTRYLGYTCSYTPLPLLHAAGFTPYRVLPMTEAPDQAGSVLHENLCPEVKRALDRALADDLPQLQGMVIINSCDAMRRLFDAWRAARPDDPCHLVDLPVSDDERAIAYLAAELEHLRSSLQAWSGETVSDNDIVSSAATYSRLADSMSRLERQTVDGSVQGGWQALQQQRIRAVTQPPEQTLAELDQLPVAVDGAPPRGVPLLLTGNVLPDPEAFALLASCGARLVADDLCTGSRQLQPMPLRPEPANESVLRQLARQQVR